MIIRCPQCEHSRTISESKIPPTAELATCPKCKHRFRFRTLGASAQSDPIPLPSGRPARTPEPFAGDKRIAHVGPSGPIPPGLEVQRPQGAVREAADRRGDVWDAVDTLHQHWQSQMDQHVTEVGTPRMQPTEEEPAGEESPEENSRHENSAALEKASEALKVRLENPSPGGTGGAAAQTAPVSRPRNTVSKIPVYPYAEDGPPPEERVERDMRMLREAPDSRPTRNLGSLRDYPDSGDARLDDGLPREEFFADGMQDGGVDEDMEENCIPWENPADHGWIKGFMSTVHGVMFRGPSFFARFSPHGSLGPGYLFFLIMGYVTIFGSLVWSQALAALLPGAVQGLTSRIALPALLLLAPIALGLMLLFVTGCIRIILLIFAPEKSSFPLVYKVVGYSMAPFVLSIVPFVGPVIGAAWFIAALIVGCRNALRLSWKLAVFAPLPPAVMLLSGLIWYFL